MYTILKNITIFQNILNQLRQLCLKLETDFKTKNRITKSLIRLLAPYSLDHQDSWESKVELDAKTNDTELDLCAARMIGQSFVL